jgi:hypothetical protein
VLDPDPNFHVDADPDPKPDPRGGLASQNDADPHADPAPSFTHVGKSDFFTFSHGFVSFGYYDWTLKGFFQWFRSEFNSDPSFSLDILLYSLGQCCGSMTFWGGSESGFGSADPCL